MRCSSSLRISATVAASPESANTALHTSIAASVVSVLRMFRLRRRSRTITKANLLIRAHTSYISALESGCDQGESMAVAGRNLGVIITASLAGLLFGFDTVVISGVTDSVRNVFLLDPGSFWAGFAVASGLVGTFIGALVAGKPGDAYGSRDALKAVGYLYLVSALGSAFCWNLESFYVFRFIGGLAIGASSVLAPVYISEIAPAEHRGRLTGLFQFNIVLGILLAFLSNALVQFVAVGEDAASDPWRLKLGIAAVPAILFAALMYTIPQSPRWL